MKRTILRITQGLVVGMVAHHGSWMAHADITTGLVLNYQFNEGSGTNITDSSGNGNHASLYNQGYSGWATGPVGGAILLNTNPPGSNFDPDYVQTVAPVTLANNTNFTFALWAKALPYSPLYNPRFFSPSGVTHWVLWQGGTGVGMWNTSPAGIQPSTDVWHHFALTYDRASGFYTVYVDGAVQGTDTRGKGAPGTVKWIFGHAETPSANYEGDQWKGYLSDLRMYNRILSASDVRELVAMNPSQLPIVINQQPAGPVTQYEGDPAINLKVTLTTGTLPSYQWWKDGTIVAGATNSTLTIGALSTNDSGNYTVVISNSVSVVTSTPPAVVTIVPVADPINTALVLNYKFNEQSGTTITDSSGNGNNATLYNDSASAWAPGRVNGAIVLNNGPAGSDCPSYMQTDVNVLLANQDNYTFAFWGKGLPRNSTANPRIFTPGTHWVLWQGGRGVGFWSATPATVEPSTDFWHHFAVTYNRPAGTYTVYVDGVAMANGSGSVRGAPGEVQWSFGHTEGLSAVGEGDTWKGYLSDMRMYNRALRPSDISAIVALAPTIPPTITRQPQDTMAYQGTAQYFALSVSVDGTLPISYHWYKDGSLISGATKATYRVDGVTTNNAGRYTVVARNTATSVTSTPPAVVTIVMPPTNGYAGAVIADGPEAYWRMDDTDAILRDSMFHHDGTYQGTPTAQGVTPGALTGDSSTCVTFGGAANFASVPASANFNGTYTSGDFSLEVWIPGELFLRPFPSTTGTGTTWLPLTTRQLTR
ncbi:MAG: immunoglobulin domain-containing protein [Verrucomicrobia bacterium]|nr:immunoglobulin domain-containing protein [Verrucomicrobiota bacterium]